MSDEEIEIIHASQHIGIQKPVRNLYKEMEHLKNENMKLQSNYSKSKSDQQQYQQLLDQSIQEIQQYQQQVSQLNLQLSNKETQLQSYQSFMGSLQKENQMNLSRFDQLKNKIDSIQISQNNKDSLIQSIQLDTNRMSQYLKSQNKELVSTRETSGCSLNGIFSSRSSITEAVKKFQQQLQQMEDKINVNEIMKNLQDFNENLNLNIQTQDQYLQDIEKLKEEIYLKQQELQYLNKFQPKQLQEEPIQQEKIYKENNLLSEVLDTSQYDESENQLAHDFEHLQQEILRSPEEEKQQWKLKLEQLINQL